MSLHFTVLFVALILDGLLGDPDWLWRRLPHPVVWIGHVINALDEGFNKSTDSQKQRRGKGLFVLIFLIILSAVSGYLGQVVINAFIVPWFFEAVVVAIFLSARSLYDHVGEVARKLENSDLGPARVAVARIVGRDPETLDRSGVSRAAIESLAENFSDGIIAPAFWYLVAGLPGLIVYKAVNTADSMIGHKSARHSDFGRATALFDDIVNLPASRITGFLCIIATAMCQGMSAARKAYGTIRRDAAQHRSPNAGWPEAAMAGGLGIALSGPRTYGGKLGNEAWINGSGRKRLSPEDIRDGLVIYVIALGVFTAIAGFLAIVL